jgi:hypothetical protein
MSRRFKCSKTAMIATGGALLTFSLALGLHLSIVRASDLRRKETKAVECAVLAEIDARNSFDDRTLKVLEAEVSRFHNRFGDAGAWARISAEFNEDWSREVGQKDNEGDYVIQNWKLKKESPKAADWPGILKAIKRIESIHGVSIAEFKMRIGDAPQPHLPDFVSLNVEVRSLRGLAFSASR